MADAPGTESPNKAPTPGSTTGSKTGPVKPPVLEGTARPASSTASKPNEPKKAAEPKASEPPVPPTPPVPPVKDKPAPSGGGNPFIAGIIGGVIGLGAAYGLAAAGLWPQAPSAPAPTDTRIAQFASAVPELQSATSSVQDELAQLVSRISTLENQPAPEAVSVAPSADPALAEEVAALAARIETLSVPAADSGVSVEAVEDLKSQLQLLRSEFADASSALETTQTKLSEVASTAQANSGRTDKLALTLSSLDFAFANARPYAPELTIIRQEMPQSAIPAPLAARAETGLPRPGDVVAKLNTVLPDMLAGQPLPENAEWQDTAASWFRGIIALRPSADAQGDGPDAIVARLEAATQRFDFDRAFEEFSKLPATMKSAAGDLGADLETLSLASQFLVDIRTRALNAEVAQ